MLGDTPDTRAQALLRRVVTDEEWAQFEQDRAITVKGQYADFVLVLGGIYIFQGGVRTAAACLILTGTCHIGCVCGAAYPALDLMVAHYIVVKKRERFFWEAAVFSPISRAFQHPPGLRQTDPYFGRPTTIPARQ